MSEASGDVKAIVDHFTGLASKHANPVDIYAAMMPGFVRLILERLDAIERELQFQGQRPR